LHFGWYFLDISEFLVDQVDPDLVDQVDHVDLACFEHQLDPLQTLKPIV